jgi:hypothetical protein
MYHFHTVDGRTVHDPRRLDSQAMKLPVATASNSRKAVFDEQDFDQARNPQRRGHYSSIFANNQPH